MSCECESTGSSASRKEPWLTCGCCVTEREQQNWLECKVRCKQSCLCHPLRFSTSLSTCPALPSGTCSFSLCFISEPHTMECVAANANLCAAFLGRRLFHSMSHLMLTSSTHFFILQRSRAFPKFHAGK